MNTIPSNSLIGAFLLIAFAAWPMSVAQVRQQKAEVKKNKDENSKNYKTAIGTIKVTIEPEKSDIMIGEPIFMKVTIKVVSDDELFVVQGGDNRNRLGRPENYKLTATGPKQKALKVIDAGMTFGGIMGPRKIDKTWGFSRELFLPNWFEFKSKGTHKIRCKTKLRISRNADYTTKPTEDDVDVEIDLTASVRVGMNRMSAMGSLIDRLGKNAVANSDNQNSLKKLLAIKDERVVKYLLEMVRMQNYTHRFNALQGLAKFRSDSALMGIEIGLDTKLEDMRKNSSNDKVAKQLVANIRHSASVALSNSKHSKAESRLLSLWNDPNDAIRITVLHRIGKLTDDSSFAILEKMTQDKNERVRNEAVRYHKLRTESANKK